MSDVSCHISRSKTTTSWLVFVPGAVAIYIFLCEVARFLAPSRVEVEGELFTVDLFMRAIFKLV